MKFSLCAPTVRHLRSAVGGGERIWPATDSSPVGESPLCSLWAASTRRETLFYRDTQRTLFSKQLSKKKPVRFRKKEEDFPHKVGSFFVRLALFSKPRMKINYKPTNQNQQTITRVHAHLANFDFYLHSFTLLNINLYFNTLGVKKKGVFAFTLASPRNRKRADILR